MPNISPAIFSANAYTIYWGWPGGRNGKLLASTTLSTTAILSFLHHFSRQYGSEFWSWKRKVLCCALHRLKSIWLECRSLSQYTEGFLRRTTLVRLPRRRWNKPSNTAFFIYMRYPDRSWRLILGIRSRAGSIWGCPWWARVAGREVEALEDRHTLSQQISQPRTKLPDQYWYK